MKKLADYGIPLLITAGAIWGYLSNVVPPLMCGLAILFAIYIFIQEYRDQQSDQELGAISAMSLPVNESLTLKPDRTNIILKGWTLPAFGLAFGIYTNYPLHVDNINLVGALCFVTSLYFVYHLAFIQDKTYYTLNAMGVLVTRHYLFSAPTTKTIPYGSITAVLFRQSFYEARKNIGTICIAHENASDDDEYYSCKLEGVDEFKEIAKLILDRANHVRSQQFKNLE